MTGLFGAELRRFWSRRAILLLAALALVSAGVLAAQTAWDTRPLTAQDRADAAAQAQLQTEQGQSEAQISACEDSPTDFLGPDATAEQCVEVLRPEAADFYPRQPLSLTAALETGAQDLALLLMALLMIAAATFIGADWASRALHSQLLFEPRRVRLWLAKAGAVTASATLVAVVAFAGFWGSLALVAAARDLPSANGFSGELAEFTARAVVLTAAAALGAFALSMLFRSTVATLALLFAYAVGGEILIRLLPVEGTGRWAAGNNVSGWLYDGFRYTDPSVTCPAGTRCDPLQVMTLLEAGSYLGVLLLLAVLFSMLSFRRRDA